MKEGFTLIELLLVVTILGILAAVAIPRLFPQSERMRAAEAVGILNAIRQAERTYFLEKGTYVTCLYNNDACWQNNLGMQNPNPGSGYFRYGASSAPLPPPVHFSASAIRNTVLENPNGQFNGTCGIDQGGVYTGNYKFCPNNA